MNQLQERHHDYVMGPNQDSRLASVAAGDTVEGVELQLDSDAPFMLRGRALRQSYSTTLKQDALYGLKTRWTGPSRNYLQQDFILESLQMANYGQLGNPKPSVPQVIYPASGIIHLDLINTGATTITNLTFYWRGVKLYPPGTVSSYTYPRRFSSNRFAYQISLLQLGFSESRLNQLFSVKSDADFVLRAAQASSPFIITTPEAASENFGEVFFRLMDHTKKPYSNDLVAWDVLFGSASWQGTIPVGSPTAVNNIAPFSTGPTQPGLWYPEIYVPANQQLWYDVVRSDGPGDGVDVQNQPEDCAINLIGAKVFPR